MAVPAFIDLVTTSSSKGGLTPESKEERILTCLSIMASGQNPDGSASTAGGAKSPIVLTANNTSEVPLTIKAAPAQPGFTYLLTVQDSPGTSYFNVQTSGGIYQNATGGNWFSVPATARTEISGCVSMYPNQGSGAVGVLIDGTYNGVTSSNLFSIFTTNSQSVDVIQIKESNVIVAGYDPKGRPYVGSAPTWGGGAGPMMFLANATTNPTAVTTGGGVIYVAVNGSLHYRGPTTDTQIAPA